ncbi:histone deacetylase, partial [Pseudoalteromonas sp. S1610]
DAEYLEIDYDPLQFILNDLNPDLVLYDAGVDIWQEDGVGKLDISSQGIEKREHLERKRCLANNTPVATVIGGGYDTDHQRLAKRHGSVLAHA